MSKRSPDHRQDLGCFGSSRSRLPPELEGWVDDYAQVFLFTDGLQKVTPYRVDVLLVPRTDMQTLTFSFIKWQLPLIGPVNNKVNVTLEVLTLGRVRDTAIYFGTSAKILIDEDATSGTSLIYKMNSSGPRTEPCGTPLVTGDHWERQPLTDTCCLRPVRKAPIHVSRLPAIP